MESQLGGPTSNYTTRGEPAQGADVQLYYSWRASTGGRRPTNITHGEPIRGGATSN